jgi:hypothetical protein
VSRSLTIFLFVLVLFSGFPEKLEAQVTHQVEFSESDLLFEQREGFDLVSLKGCIGSQKSGSPDLPIRMIHLALPPGCEVTGVSVVDAERTTLGRSFSILPAQPDAKTDGSIVEEWVNPDPAVYDSDAPYPSQLVEMVGDGHMGGNRVISLAVSPLQYLPESQTLILHTQVKIKVELGSSKEVARSAQANRRSARAQELHEKILTRFVDNRGEAPHYVREPGGASLSGADSGDSGFPEYLVVTSPELRTAFSPLVSW